MKFDRSDAQTLLRLFRWRRDVRHFKSEPLKKQEIEQLKQAFELAPSVGNSSPWRIVEVKSKAVREQIVRDYEDANSKAASIYQDSERQEYEALKLAGLKEAPLQLAIFTDNDPANGRGLGRQTMPETLTYSTIAAINQLWLLARALNIGVGWVSIINPENMNDILDVDPDWNFTAYLCMGYPQFLDDKPELHRTGWQKNSKSEWIER